MNHKNALFIALWLINELNDGCERIEIAGSIRRGKPEVKDIEIVAIPILKPPRPEFGQKVIHKTPLDKKLYELEETDGMLKRVKGGDKFKQFEIKRLTEFGLDEPLNPFKLDLFLVTPPAQWGVQMVIWTGPNKDINNFSQWMVTEKKKGGALPDGYIVKDGVVGEKIFVNSYGKMDRKGEIGMPEEEDFFRFCGLNWIEPSKRQARWEPGK